MNYSVLPVRSNGLPIRAFRIDNGIMLEWDIRLIADAKPRSWLCCVDFSVRRIDDATLDNVRIMGNYLQRPPAGVGGD